MPEEVDAEGAEAEAVVLKPFGRSSGLAFRGLALSFGREEGVVAVGATCLVGNDEITLSVPSSLFGPSSTGGGDPEKQNPDAACPSSSAPTRRTCPAIGRCSRCSSEIVERSFLSTASYNGEVFIRSCRLTDDELRSHTCFSNAFGLLSIQTINYPFSVSSTSATPDLPRRFTDSVNVTHHVEFMCKWFLS